MRQTSGEASGRALRRSTAYRRGRSKFIHRFIDWIAIKSFDYVSRSIKWWKWSPSSDMTAMRTQKRCQLFHFYLHRSFKTFFCFVRRPASHFPLYVCTNHDKWLNGMLFFLFSRLSRLLRDRCDGYCRPRRAAAAATAAQEIKHEKHVQRTVWTNACGCAWTVKVDRVFTARVASALFMRASKTFCTASYLFASSSAASSSLVNVYI